MTKKFLLGTIGFIALSMTAPASAADMAVKAPPPVYVAPMYSWAGFYIGGNGGWGDSHKRFEFGALSTSSSDASGGTIGGQIGYNWQSSVWVFGLEAQGNWADLGKTIVDPAGGAAVRSQVDALGLFTGRIGYAANNALFYVKGGAGVASNDYTATLNNVNFYDAHTTRWGGDVGLGFAYGFSPNWSFGAEYNHLFLSRQAFNWSTAYSNVGIKQDIDLVTLRIDYHFGGADPVVARY